ncbi:MAG TPA: M28 family metallopeptidase [Gemmatimonadaceae bacterium]|nr:M28 family metallopeptidase [Gemmatimonadaceae bacterium]
MRHLLIGLCAISACSPTTDQPAVDSAALASITTDDLMRHTQRLASDGFEGRAPGTPGEDSTVAYLTSEFQRLGLAPGNPDGSFIQNVEMVGFTATPTAAISAGGNAIALRFPDDYVAVSRHEQPQIDVVNSDIVFVGYGVVAPEYGWDDYKDVDVRGKTIVMLINDPAIASPNDSTQLDSAIFRGNAMTYYGRWTYKYEIASEKGAAAAIIVHETGPAGYPYEVVQGSWGRENLDVKRAAGAPYRRVQVESWMTLDKTKELLSAAGFDFDSLKRAALSKDFRPVALNAKATFRIKNTIRQLQSRNVIAKLEGSDSTLRDEYVVYTAHWDHLGRDTTREGDQIFNGALDNASGVAQMLEIAEAFTQLPEAPKRSILFLAVTAEEKGLLGAKYYAENPLYPLAKTLANINIDGVNQWGRTSDITVIGLGNSTLDDVLHDVATATERNVNADPEPEKGYFYRSDHFEFAKQGVPALYIDSGIEYIGKDSTYSQQKREEYVNNDYHKPTDEVKPDWDLSGAVDDARLLVEVGYRVAQGDTWPAWKPGVEFKRDTTGQGSKVNGQRDDTSKSP